jgi:hypothetical protein
MTVDIDMLHVDAQFGTLSADVKRGIITYGEVLMTVNTEIGRLENMGEVGDEFEVWSRNNRLQSFRALRDAIQKKLVTA